MLFTYSGARGVLADRGSQFWRIVLKAAASTGVTWVVSFLTFGLISLIQFQQSER
jgi:hypothetical protein